MIKDQFENYIDSPVAPAESCFAITPSNSQDLEIATKALFIGTGGDVALVPIRGTGPVVFRNVQSGSIIDVRVRAVKASGTTAENIVGLA